MEKAEEKKSVTLSDFIVERIEYLCEERHMSKYKLGQITDIAQSSLSTMTNGKTLPSITTLEKLCEGLGITIFEFFSSNAEATTITNQERIILKYWHELDDHQKEVLLAFAKGLIVSTELKK